jgi:hypothetical protein
MKAFFPRAAAILLGSLLSLAATLVAGPALSNDPQPNLNQFAWMAGDWNAVVDKALVDEHWSRPSGNMMMGMSRTVAGDETLSFEYLRIESRETTEYS